MIPPFPTLAKLGVLIRFKNSAATLPAVLAALRAQTLQPELLLGVDSGSTDGSADLLRAAGGEVVAWTAPYHHSKVLNFGLARCPAERVLVLSSHTVLESPEALAKLNAALDDPATACASAKWDGDGYYSDSIDWAELEAKGLKLGSIYSNSFGLLRRSLWEQLPFDEAIPTMEDYNWALEQIRRGHRCGRVEFAFSYQRQAEPRDFLFTSGVFTLAARYGLRVRWLGRKGTALSLWQGLWAMAFRRLGTTQERAAWQMHWDRLWASFVWRWNFASA